MHVIHPAKVTILLKTLFRIAPEIIFCTAIGLLVAQMSVYVGDVWTIGRSGLQFENFSLPLRLIGAVASALIEPAMLFGLAAIVAALRTRSEG